MAVTLSALHRRAGTIGFRNPRRAAGDAGGGGGVGDLSFLPIPRVDVASFVFR